ncbi:uncharacterized protein LOC134181541 isoform X2 [Corticium candelabrum]|uniref:uncharacterized protein LOC134181541 isoform X2 n=1 Tax=Corticium candelabrum TaxID=121492 RepID=UPI002E25D58B|nr:uncharacterized protein LOC134181541 isoform X2 [Corticium candelabrum]
MTDKWILLFQQLSEEAMEAELDYFTHWWNTHHMRKHTQLAVLVEYQKIFLLFLSLQDLRITCVLLILNCMMKHMNYSHLFNFHFTAGNLRKLHSHC